MEKLHKLKIQVAAPELKHSMFIILFISLIGLFPKQAFSQIYPYISGKPDDFKNMKGRTLIVAIKEEDPTIVETYTKKKKTAELDKYRKEIADINQMMKIAVTKYWTFNKNIEYKTLTEIHQIDKKEKKNYAIMYYNELQDQESFNNMRGLTGLSSMSVPVITYNELENMGDNGHDPSNMVYLPPMNIPDTYNTPRDWDYMQCSFDFSIRELQAHTEYIIKTNKRITYEDYAVKMSAENKCEKLKKTDVLLSKNHLATNDGDDVKQGYSLGACEFADDTTINNAFVNEKDGKSVMFIVAYGIAAPAGRSSAKNSYLTYLAYFKLVVDCKTGDVLYMNKSNKDYSWYVSKTTLEGMSQCK